MKRFFKASWKRALFVLTVFAFVSCAVATTKAPAPGDKREGKVAHSEKGKKPARNKTQAEVKNDVSLAAASEGQNEQDESAVSGARKTAESLEEKSEADEG
jgi:hypothetical protein